MLQYTFVRIDLKQFIRKTLKLSEAEGSGLTEAGLHALLDQMLAAKRAGQTCETCGQPIWVVGSSLAGYPTCFTCLTGETDCSKDYEISEA